MEEYIHDASIDPEKEIMFRMEGEAGSISSPGKGLKLTELHRTEDTVQTGIARIERKRGKRETTKIVEFYMNKSAMLSYSPDTIVSSQRIYSLYSVLPSKLSQEDKYVMIENDMLGIVATGKTEEEAEQDFAHEFDFIYQRYNQLADDQMTERIKRIKTLLNTIVKAVTEI